MTWCLWCAERLKMIRGHWRHQDGSIYKTHIGAYGVVCDDHCVLPTSDQEAAERMAAERRKDMAR